MWQKPWGYKEGFAICGGLFLTGIFLQMTVGKCTLSILSYPVNVCVGLLYVVILLSAYTFSQKSYFIRWMGSCQAAVSSMVSVAVLTVVMGLIRQVKSDIPLSGIENWLGFLHRCPPLHSNKRRISLQLMHKYVLVVNTAMEC